MWHFLEQLLVGCGVFSIPLGIFIQLIPNELVLAYGGYLVGSLDASFLLIFLLAWVAFVTSQVGLYWLGRYGGRPVALKLYRSFRIKPEKQLLAEAWFEKYGAWIVCLSLIWRQLFAISAGVMRLSFRKFFVVTTLVFAVWSFVFVKVGMMLGSNWRQIGAFMHGFGPYVLLAIALFFGVRYILSHPSILKKSA
ncbi:MULTISPECIES: DedA family protein [Exiguobacterium]|uniref:DedA family protein n=1 Tax=Exiguobacterium TaxID=33986 RepID=UPI001BE7B962|nr:MULTISPECIES: VTT domain-containing protein [Exiguobacterium]MCT4782809.1 VTT domain-containing protein [Exiguobacterium himgiriensis]